MLACINSRRSITWRCLHWLIGMRCHCSPSVMMMDRTTRSLSRTQSKTRYVSPSNQSPEIHWRGKPKAPAATFSPMRWPVPKNASKGFPLGWGQYFGVLLLCGKLADPLYFPFLMCTGSESVRLVMSGGSDYEPIAFLTHIISLFWYRCWVLVIEGQCRRNKS
jgi:hypothetical protein